jgi:hypothetical protein
MSPDRRSVRQNPEKPLESLIYSQLTLSECPRYLTECLLNYKDL